MKSTLRYRTVIQFFFLDQSPFIRWKIGLRCIRRFLALWGEDIWCGWVSFHINFENSGGSNCSCLALIDFLVYLHKQLSIVTYFFVLHLFNETKRLQERYPSQLKLFSSLTNATHTHFIICFVFFRLQIDSRDRTAPTLTYHSDDKSLVNSLVIKNFARVTSSGNSNTISTAKSIIVSDSAEVCFIQHKLYVGLCYHFDNVCWLNN